MTIPSVDASTIANIPKYTPIQKSARARLQIKKRGTLIVDRPLIDTNRTVPFPNIASMNTIQIPQRNVHQPNKSLQGKNGPNNKIENYRYSS